MKTYLHILVSGAVIAGVAFGLLRIARPEGSAGRDLWSDHFRSAGLDAHLHSISSEPEKHFLIPELRGRLHFPGFPAVSLREYVVEDVQIQIAAFATTAHLRSILEEAERVATRKPDRRRFWVRGEGRFLLVIENYRRVGLERRYGVSSDLASRITNAFVQGACSTE